MMLSDMPDLLEGRKVRGIGFTWYQGAGLVVDLWHKRISWSPRWIFDRRRP